MVLFPDRRSSDEENLGVDWVIHYQFDGIDPAEAIDEFRTLIRDLDEAGLRTQVRHGRGASLLVFLNATRERLGHEVFKSRVKDWLDGVSDVRPVGDSDTVIDGDTEAEELRAVHRLVTGRKDDGGAEVTPNRGKWKNVKACFPLHSPTANRGLFRRWRRIKVLQYEDLDGLRALFGEKIALYFAFGQCYGLFLAGMTVFATISWIYHGSYSVSFAVFSCFWCLAFVEFWKVQQTDLSIRWGSRGVGELKVNRIRHIEEQGARRPTTPKAKEIYQIEKQLLRQLPQFALAIVVTLALGALVLVTFAVELLIAETYTGPFKAVLDFLPTIVLSVFLPTIASALSDAATRLTDYENHVTQGHYELAHAHKTFMSRFITYFLPLLMTAFIYVPFGDWIASSPVFRFIGSSVQNLRYGERSAHIDPSRLQQQVIYFVLISLMVHFKERNFLPHGTRVPFVKYLHALMNRPGNILHRRQLSSSTPLLLIDHPEEATFLSRVRGESEASVYDLRDSLLDTCCQFGSLALFGAAWPLASLIFFLDHWTALRNDLFSIIIEWQRPPPFRTDTIGPWLDILELLAWLGSLSTAAIVHLYRRNVREVKLWSLLLTILITEQLYYATRFVIRTALQRIGSETIRREQARRDTVQKRYLETFSEEAAELCRIYKPRVRFREIAEIVIERARRNTDETSNKRVPTAKDEEEDVEDVEDVESVPEILSRTGTDRLRDAENSTKFWSWNQTAQETINAGIKLIEALSVASRLGRPAEQNGQNTPKKAD